MGKQLINVGAAPNDKSGDSLRAASQKINSNFTEIYASIGNGVTLTVAPVAKTGNYNDLTNKPDLAVYALQTQLFSGAYADLTGKPNLFSGSYADLTGKPTLSTVSATGNYADLTGLPTLFSGAYADLTGLPVLFSGDYADLTNSPVLFSGSFLDLSDKPSIFSVVAVTGQENVTADNTNSTLTIASGNNIAITTSAENNSVTVTNTYAPTYQEFTSSAVWYKPPGATVVEVEIIGAGAGGGAGAVAPTTSARFGGGGGGGGARLTNVFLASSIPSNVAITVGAGGSGGSGSTDGVGANGSDGGDSRFGDFLFTGIAKGGQGGTQTSGVFGSVSFKASSPVNAGNGSGGFSGTPTVQGGSATSGGSGGGGGGGAAANITAASAGAPGGLGRFYAITEIHAEGVVGADGQNALQPGGGGAGGGYLTGSNGKAGGSGAFPGGAGGGGSAADNGLIAGPGGAGASGIVRVWTY